MNTNALENETHLSSSPQFSCPLLDRFLEVSRGKMDAVYIANSVLNGAFSCLSVFANALIMATILRTPCLRSPTFYLLFGLAVSDFGVGLLAQPLYIMYKIAGLYENSNLNCAAGIAFVLGSNQLSGVSFLTMTLLSLDRFLALHLHLRYNEIFTLSRVNIALVSTWVLSAFLNIAWLLNLKAYYVMSSCGFVSLLIATLLTYVMIFRIVRKHRRKIQQQVVAVSHLKLSFSIVRNSAQDTSNSERTSSHLEPSRLDATSNKKSAKNIFLIYFVFLICVLPLTCVLVASSILGRNTAVETAFNFTMTLVFINSAMNPFLYCILMRDLRKEVRKTLGCITGHLTRA